MTQYFSDYLQENANMQEEQLVQLKTKLQFGTFQKGDFVLQEGQVCKQFFYVEKGLLRLYSIDDSGKEHIVQFASEGWFISDRSSVYFNEPSKFFIDAVENTEVVILDEEILHFITQISPQFQIYNEHLLQNHIRQLQNRINLLISASAECRYLDFIKLYPDLMQRVPQWMIASYLGITPESLSRVRKELSKK